MTDEGEGTNTVSRHPGWPGVVGRTASLTASALLAAGAVGLTWLGVRAPANQSADVAAMDVPMPADDVVYACHGAPGNTLGAVDVGRTTATTTLSSLDGDSTLTYGGKTLTEPVTTLAEASDGLLSVARADRAPTGAVGVTTTLSADGDLRGLTAAPCTPPTAISWIVGGSTQLGSSAELRLTNPGTTSLTAAIRLYGSVGELLAPSGGRVVVPPGKTMGFLLEAAGTDSRLALSVEATGGTLVPALVTEALDGETAAGTEVTTAGAAPSTDLTVPGVVLTDAAAQGEKASDAAEGAPVSSDAPVVRVVNPGDEPATVAVSMVGPDGTQPLPGAGSLVVDPGAVFDVSLGGVPAGAYGVHVGSDAPVTAGVRLVRSAGEYPERSGALLHDVAWSQATASDAGEAGSIALPRGGEMSSDLVLTNSGRSPAAVSLTSADGTWSRDVEVPAGTTVTPEVPDEIAALTIAGSGSQEVAAAAVVTTQVTGSAAGTLIAVVPAVADSTALSETRLLLR